MLREALFAKIHHARVTECNPEYSGSITIDAELLEATGLLANEKVLVANCENGVRLETYVFEGPAGSGVIGLNGAAAQHVSLGDRVLVMSFCQVTSDEMRSHRPKVVICDADNRVHETIEYDPAAMAVE